MSSWLGPPSLLNTHHFNNYNSSESTTQLILQTLLTLVSSPGGAKVFTDIEDVSPLIEIAPSHPLALDVFLHAYVQTATLVGDQPSIAQRIGKTIESLTASFKGTDAVTLLSFIDTLLRRLDPEVCLSTCQSPNCMWY